MKNFKVYKHPVSGYEAVKIGFSWPAAIFTGIWLLVKKLWGMAALWTVLFVTLSLIEKATDKATREPQLQSIVYLALTIGYLCTSLIPGFKGNGWRISNLEKRGYEFLHEVRASTPDAAIAEAARKFDPAIPSDV